MNKNKVLWLLMLAPTSVSGQVTLEIERGAAYLAVVEFSRQSDLQVLFDYPVLAPLITAPLEGTFKSYADALQHWLKGTGLQYDFVNPYTVAITPLPKHEPPTPRRHRPAVSTPVDESCVCMGGGGPWCWQERTRTLIDVDECRAAPYAVGEYE